MHYSSVQGSVVPVDPNVQVQVLLVSDDPTIDGHRTLSARTDGSGRFGFSNVPPGNYTLTAQTFPGQPKVVVVEGRTTLSVVELTDDQKLWARVPVVVPGEREIEVSLLLQPSRSISGVVVFETTKRTNPARTGFSVRLSLPLSPRDSYLHVLPDAKVGPDGRFTLTGVSPGRYTLELYGGHLKSAVIGAGQETLDFPLDFTGDRDITDAVLTRPIRSVSCPAH